ncbi:MAG: nucleotidyltransferase family protein [Eubacterium sp.]|nr:nucleotidyltransferase family protein [Eubacterium sp.]
MYKTNNKEADLLLNLIRATLKGEPLQKVDGADMNALLELANRQQVYNLVLPLLEQKKMLTDAEYKSWRNYKLSEITKTLTINNERKAVCEKLEEQGIDYMFLKGLVIRDYYPKSSMRQMSDNDIMFDASRADDLIKIMKAQGFYLASAGGATYDFGKPPCTIEFHRTLFIKKEQYDFELDPWLRAKRIDDTHQFAMDSDDNLIYSLCHMYKHYVGGGCGIRFLCDTYVLLNGGEYDFDYINPTLERFNIADFSKTVFNLVDVVFNDKEPGEDEKALLCVMLGDTVFGKTLTVEDKINQSGGRFKYLLERIFPSKKIMFGTYQKLNSAPYLLPYYYMVRLHDRWKYNRNKVKSELRQIQKKD